MEKGKGDTNRKIFCIQEGKEWQKRDGDKLHGCTYINAEGGESGVLLPSGLVHKLKKRV